ncbi:CDP-glycerol glycerophosphotransferase family protein [Vagococcus zengguangii]|uniref:Glycosyltransferase n=1 Tax=Vagococcus zengguangii TaxID=2571750 RepID=A0A4D7CUT3_9ENTE|nr:CDP-glycerol glycerophosphotransferase family protein [Vagococcus zengguangii]QCI87044.1 glycosyltransferase [Vagococcus zengguangii]
MIKKVARAFKQNILDREAIHYINYSEKLPIEENLVFVESTQGSEFTGHIFAIVQELSNNHQNLRVVLSLREPSKFEKLNEKYQLPNVTVVKFRSKQYMRYLATAKYIVNDTTFWDFFNKRPGQQYYIIWHGTPLKKMGNETDSPLDVSNVQRNFYQADRLYFSNDYTKEIMIRAYGLTNIYGGQLVVGPSPRNSLLFAAGKQSNDKELIFYMPTWRGTLGNQTDELDKMVSDLEYLSAHLRANQELVVKFHPFQMQFIKEEDFPNITFYDKTWELYDFLSQVDILITDYSSIMFDFANTQKRILLYTYDKEEYFSTRGVYRQVDEFPFEEASTIEELTNLVINQPLSANDYSEFLAEFCPVDQANGTKQIVQHMFEDKSSDSITVSSCHNGKETVFLMVGGLWDNGITTALLNMFDNIDADKRNYVLYFYKNLMKAEHLPKLSLFPESVQYYPISGIPQGNTREKMLRLLYLKKEDVDKPKKQQVMKKIYHREYRRLFGDLPIDWMISYTGFEREIAQLLISDLPCKTGSFMHTDMYEEYKLKQSFSMKIMTDVYQTVDAIIPVNRQIGEEVVKRLPERANAIKVVNNFLNVKKIRELALANLSETLVEVSVDYPLVQMEEEQQLSEERIKAKLLDDLANPELTHFIHIGRYAKEKSQDRLIRAFEENYQQNPMTRLILVAPHGPLKEAIMTQVEASPAKDAITILGRMDNPYPLLKAADCFVLTSLYEGLGLVLYEALALETDVITVDIPATVERLTEQNAIIVPNTQEGINAGVTQYLNARPDFEPFNFDGSDEQSKREWENVFE